MATETFGDVVVRILYTIINGIVGTALSVIRDILVLVNTIQNNLAKLSPLAIIIGLIIIGAIIYGLFRLFKGQVKPLIIAIAILFIILMALLLL